MTAAVAAASAQKSSTAMTDEVVGAHVGTERWRGWTEHPAVEPLPPAQPRLSAPPRRLPVADSARGHRIYTAIAADDPLTATSTADGDAAVLTAIRIIRFVLRAKGAAGWYVYGDVVSNLLLRGDASAAERIHVACGGTEPAAAAREVAAWAQSRYMDAGPVDERGLPHAVRIKLSMPGSNGGGVTVELTRSSHGAVLAPGAHVSCSNFKLAGPEAELSCLWRSGPSSTLGADMEDCLAGVARILDGADSTVQRARMVELMEGGWALGWPDGRPWKPISLGVARSPHDYTANFEISRAWASSDLIFGHHAGASPAQVAAAVALCSSERVVECSRCAVRSASAKRLWEKHIAGCLSRAAASCETAAAPCSAGVKRSRDPSWVCSAADEILRESAGAAVGGPDDPFEACDPDCSSRRSNNSAFLCANCS